MIDLQRLQHLARLVRRLRAGVRLDQLFQPFLRLVLLAVLDQRLDELQLLGRSLFGVGFRLGGRCRRARRLARRRPAISRPRLALGGRLGPARGDEVRLAPDLLAQLVAGRIVVL